MYLCDFYPSLLCSINIGLNRLPFTYSSWKLITDPRICLFVCAYSCGVFLVKVESHRQEIQLIMHYEAIKSLWNVFLRVFCPSNTLRWQSKPGIKHLPFKQFENMYQKITMVNTLNVIKEPSLLFCGSSTRIVIVSALNASASTGSLFCWYVCWMGFLLLQLYSFWSGILVWKGSNVLDDAKF